MKKIYVLIENEEGLFCGSILSEEKDIEKLIGTNTTIKELDDKNNYVSITGIITAVSYSSFND